MRICVIIPAAGSSRRFQSGAAENKNKLEIDLGGKPMFLRTVDMFLQREEVSQIILAVNPDAVDDFKFKYGDALGFHGVKIVAGGKKERWETVLLALKHAPDDATHIAVHDAARPLGTKAMLDRVFQAARSFKAVVPAKPITPTLRRAKELDAAAQENQSGALSHLDDLLGGTAAQDLKLYEMGERVDRAGLWGMQTPQVFRAELLRSAYEQLAAREDKSGVTDDAELVQSMGEAVHLVDGETTNIKITHPEDEELAQALYHWQDVKKDKVKEAEKQLFKDDDDEMF